MDFILLIVLNILVGFIVLYFVDEDFEVYVICLYSYVGDF